MKYVEPSKPGRIEARTGRVAVLVADYAGSDLNGDSPAYWFNTEADDLGLDPWKLVEGVDPHTNGANFDVWFASGSFKTVGPLMTIYLSAKDAEKLGKLSAA